MLILNYYYRFHLPPQDDCVCEREKEKERNYLVSQTSIKFRVYPPDVASWAKVKSWGANFGEFDFQAMLGFQKNQYLRAVSWFKHNETELKLSVDENPLVSSPH